MQPHKMGGAFTAPLPLRAHSFLYDDRTAAAIKQSIVDVTVGAEGGGSGAQLPLAATNMHILEQIQKCSDVVHLMWVAGGLTQSGHATRASYHG